MNKVHTAVVVVLPHCLRLALLHGGRCCWSEPPIMPPLRALTSRWKSPITGRLLAFHVCSSKWAPPKQHGAMRELLEFLPTSYETVFSNPRKPHGTQNVIKVNWFWSRSEVAIMHPEPTNSQPWTVFGSAICWQPMRCRSNKAMMDKSWGRGNNPSLRPSLPHVHPSPGVNLFAQWTKKHSEAGSVKPSERCWKRRVSLS